MLRCEKCKHYNCEADKYPCAVCDSNVNDLFEEKKPTNADRIRTMNDKELAEFFSILDHSYLHGECFICFGVDYISDNEQKILEWLQSEVK